MSQPATAGGHDENLDGDTTAAAVVPTVINDVGQDDETVEQQVDPSVAREMPRSARALRAPEGLKEPATLGLLVAGGSVRYAEPSIAGEIPPTLATQADAEDESITATAPNQHIRDEANAVLLGKYRLVPDGAVEALPSAPLPAAGRPSTTDEAESVTSPTPWGAKKSASSSEMTPSPAAGGPLGEEVFSVRDAYEEEESVTTRAPPMLLEYSVTTQAPRAPLFEGGPDGMTKPLPKRARSEGLDDPETITVQAPGYLTDALRGITDESVAIANKTAIMPGAPVKPRTVFAAAASSDDGLRAPPGSALQSDHASGAVIRTARDTRPVAFADTEQAFSSGPHRAQPFRSTGNKPRYGLLVGIVGGLSFAIPVAVFLWLQSAADDDLPPRAASEVVPDPVRSVGVPRARVTKSAPSAGSASATHSSAPSRGPSLPRHR